MREPARRGQEACRHVFGVEPGLESMACQLNLILDERQGLTACHPQLPFHQIQAGHGFGDRMLHLEPRIHFHEPEAVGAKALRPIDDEFHRSGTGIADRFGGLDGCRTHGGAHLRRHAGRRGLLDHLLMTTLQRTIALEQVHGIATVPEDLHFDMAGGSDIFLDQDGIIAERMGRFRLRSTQGIGKIGGRIDASHSLAAATGDRLDEHRIANGIRLPGKKHRVLIVAVIAGHDRNAGLLHQCLGSILQTHGADRFRRRTDEDEAGPFHRLDEVRIFRQEAIAGMNGLGARLQRCGNDGIPLEIAVLRGRTADGNRLIRHGDMQGARVDIGMNRNRRNAQLSRRCDDATGDLPAIGDQDLAKHGLCPPDRHHMRNRPKRVSPIGALRLAESDRARTSRVFRGSTMPSSQSRAEA